MSTTGKPVLSPMLTFQLVLDDTTVEGRATAESVHPTKTLLQIETMTEDGEATI